MTILDKQEKQPREVFDYDIAFAAPDLPATDSVASAVVTVTPSVAGDLTLTIGVVDVSVRNRVKVWIGGGTDGRTYKVTVRTMTTGGRTFEDEFVLKIKEL
jgi:hypothetical protein